MNSVDRFLKWTFNFFVFLICFQFGVLVFLYSFYEKRKKEQLDLEPEVAFACGDFDNEESYFPFPDGGQDPRACLHQECPDSLWVLESNEQEMGLHVLAAARPMEQSSEDEGRGNGISIKVDLSPSEKPYTLVLVSKKDLTIWDLNLKEGHNLKKVILLNPGLTWISGLPEKSTDAEGPTANNGNQVAEIPVEYFSSKKICAYPVAWEEIGNPNNEFRRLYRALEKHTGLKITSFQGKKEARVFTLPPIRSKREIASEWPLFAQSNENSGGESKSPDQAPGLKWQRNESRLQAKGFQYTEKGQQKLVPVPRRTQKALYSVHEKKIYMIRKFDFGVWYPGEKKFQRLPIPLALPNMRWPTSMALDTKRSQILVYNDERGGEVYIYNLKRKTWKRTNKTLGYSLSDLVYSQNEDVYYGTRIVGGEITQLVKVSTDGQILGARSIATPKPYSRSLWHMEMAEKRGDLWLWVFHPANPKGDAIPLNAIKATL